MAVERKCITLLRVRPIRMSWKARILVTVFIEKTEDEIRLISARLATRPERRRYEEGE
jgi:uncharacterized DUF497 family protein